MIIPENDHLGEAVHRVLTYLSRHPVTSLEEFKKHIPKLKRTTRDWTSIPRIYRIRILTHWFYIANLYLESGNVWLEEKGLKGYRPDMTRRMQGTFQVIEFKIVSNPTSRKKSRQQIRDTMAKLKKTLPPDAAITGHIVILPCDLSHPPTPIWEDVPFTPASS